MRSSEIYHADSGEHGIGLPRIAQRQPSLAAAKGAWLNNRSWMRRPSCPVLREISVGAHRVLGFERKADTVPF
jgi:hypothetical protein